MANTETTGDIAPEFKASSAADFKAKSLRKGKEMVLPSGFTCVATRVNLMVFMKTGRIPNSLRGLIDKGMSGKEVTQDEILDKLLSGDDATLKSFEDMMNMVDAVVCDVMIDPKVIPAPDNEEPRSEENPKGRSATLLHVDEMDEEDRMFVFNFAVGGTRDLETFRKGQNSNVERILAQSGSGGTTE
jgi:hypothetical protein